MADLRISKRFSINWRIELFYQIAVSIHHMHELGYAHCDLKPQNIMFRVKPSPDEAPAPVLVDFGSVSQVEGPVRRLAITPPYAPLEALSAFIYNENPLNIRPMKWDIWSLGTILFEIVAGKQLFESTEPSEIASTIIQKRIRKFRDVDRSIPEGLDILLEQMLKTDPQARPDIRQVIEAVDERISAIRSPRPLS